MKQPNVENGYTNCGIFTESNTNKQTKQNRL